MHRIPLFALALCTASSVASAQAVNVTWHCVPQGTPTALQVGDAAGHAYVLDQVKCTALKGSVLGVKEKDGIATEFSEATSNNSKGHGEFVETLSSGDQIHYTYTLTGVSKDGKPVAGSNKWTAVGGTGKFKGATGSGTCKGTVFNADGSANYDCTGNITAAGK
jgi:hypothetical protein